MVVLVCSVLFVGALRRRDLPDASIVHTAPAIAMGRAVETTVVYTVRGPDRADATVIYFEPDGLLQRVVVRLPWSVSAQTRRQSPAASVLAQSPAGSISCEISVNGLTLIARQSARDSSPVDCTLPAT
jgi:MmpS family membrane protein